jgi:3-hydroxyisobutyrate dehydrogenase
MTMKEKIGFVGLGLMGAPMAMRLIEAGYPLCVFNRTKQKAESLLLRGAVWCDSPAAVASQSKIVLSMISTPSALEEVTLSKKGILSTLEFESIHVDCSTVSPTLTQQLAEKYRTKKCHFLHSPVLGSVPQVIAGTLLLFVGGDKGAFTRVEPVLKCLGSKIWRFDHVEQASTTKLLCNSFISGMAIILSQALVLAQKADIDPKTLLEIVSHSQLNAPMYQSKGSSILERNFSPRFFVEHLLKDTHLILEVAQSLKVPFPVGAIAHDLFTEAMQAGFAKEDYSAVIKVLEAEAGVEVK